MMKLLSIALAVIGLSASQPPEVIPEQPSKGFLGSSSKTMILKTEKEIDIYLSNVQKSLDDLLMQLTYQLDLLKRQAGRSPSQAATEYKNLVQSCEWLQGEIRPYLFDVSKSIKIVPENIAVNKKAIERTEYQVEAIFGRLEQIMPHYNAALAKKLKIFNRQLGNAQVLTSKEKNIMTKNARDLEHIIKESSELLLLVPAAKK